MSSNEAVIRQRYAESTHEEERSKSSRANTFTAPDFSGQ
jgi:hypothetical protein